jgi:hypothetical protein
MSALRLGSLFSLAMSAAVVAQAAGSPAALLVEPRAGFERFTHRRGGVMFRTIAAASTFERVDGDALPDAIFHGAPGDVRLNLGNAEFGPSQYLAPPWPSTCPVRWSSPPIVLDADGDGDVDWFVCMATDPGCPDRHEFLFLNDGAGNLTLSAGAIPPLPCGSLGGAAADFDGDGDLDIAVGGAGTFNTCQTADEYLENDGRGRFTLRSGRIPVVIEFTHQLIAADVDGDGAVDLVKLTMSAFSQNSHVLLNDGSGHFRHAQVLANVVGFPVFDFGDLNGDGCVDLVSGDRLGASAVQLLMGSSQGLLIDNTWRLPYGANTWHGLPRLTDLDGDGDRDIAVPERQSRFGAYRIVRYWQNDGAANFTDVSDALMPVVGGEISPPRPNWYYDLVTTVPADQDGDGDVDLLVVPAPIIAPPPGGFTLWNLTRHIETSGNPSVGQSSYRVSAFADPGHVVIPLASLGRTILGLPGLGVLQIDPATAIAGPPLSIGPSRVADLPMPIPSDPGLVGTSIYWQGIDIDVAANSWNLTNAVHDTVR